MVRAGAATPSLPRLFQHPPLRERRPQQGRCANTAIRPWQHVVSHPAAADRSPEDLAGSGRESRAGDRAAANAPRVGAVPRAAAVGPLRARDGTPTGQKAEPDVVDRLAAAVGGKGPSPTRRGSAKTAGSPRDQRVIRSATTDDLRHADRRPNVQNRTKDRGLAQAVAPKAAPRVATDQRRLREFRTPKTSRSQRPVRKTSPRHSRSPSRAA